MKSWSYAVKVSQNTAKLDGEQLMNRTIQDFIDLKRIAVVGVSKRAHKYGPRVYHDLKARGYDVVPVNPKLETLDGQTCYPNLNAIPEPVDGVVIIIPPDRVPSVLREAAEANIRYVWLQPGAEPREAGDLADEFDLKLVHNGACVMVEARHAGRSYVS
jgi:predicted CoA-binding protein